MVYVFVVLFGTTPPEFILLYERLGLTVWSVVHWVRHILSKERLFISGGIDPTHQSKLHMKLNSIYRVLFVRLIERMSLDDSRSYDVSLLSYFSLIMSRSYFLELIS